MSFERLNADLADHPEWPALAELLQNETPDYFTWDALSEAIITLEDTPAALNWRALLRDDETQGETQTPHHAYIEAVLIPVVRAYCQRHSIERNANLDWLNRVTPTMCWALAHHLSLDLAFIDMDMMYDEDLEDVDTLEDTLEDEDWESQLLIRAQEYLMYVAEIELPDLRSLEIFGTVSTTTLIDFLERANLVELEQLWLDHPIEAHNMQRLLERCTLPALQRLSMFVCAFQPDDLIDIDQTTTSIQPTVLTLSVLMCHEQPMQRLLNHTMCAKVETLVIQIPAGYEESDWIVNTLENPPQSNEIVTPNMLRVFAQTQQMSLHHLNIEYNARTPHTPLGPLPERSSLDTLLSLSTFHLSMSAEDIATLTNRATSLESLHLLNANIDDDGLLALMDSVAFKQSVQHLSLDNNRIGPQGARHLATSARLDSLQSFSMLHNIITISSTDHLKTLYSQTMNLSDQGAFGELRSLLQNKPSPQVWRTLCEHLDMWADTPYLREVALPYLNDHLEHWPDDLCLLPEQWLVQIIEHHLMPYLNIVRTLEVRWLDNDPTLLGRGLVEAIPFLTQLKHIHISEIDAQSLINVLKSPIGQRLETLEISTLLQGPMAETLVDELSTCAPNTTPKVVVLTDQTFHPNTFPSLVRSGFLNNTETLCLQDCMVFNIHTIHDIPDPSLRVLRLRNCDLHEGEFEALLNGPGLQNLEHLDMLGSWSNQVETIRALGQSNDLQRLNMLTVSSFDLAPEEFLPLFQTRQLPTLEHLSLNSSTLEHDAVRALTRAPYSKQLKTIDLSYCMLGNRAIDAFTDVDWTPAHFFFNGNVLNAEDIERFARLPWLEHLEHLQLYDTFAETVSIKDLEPLFTSTRLRNLKKFEISGDCLYMQDAEVQPYLDDPDVLSVIKQALQPYT